MDAAKILKMIEAYDTPSVTNVVATYPNDKTNCLGLYNPWEIDWYSDQTLKCIYPELGRRAGYVVTATYGMPDPAFSRLDFLDILKAIYDSPKPVILAIKQNFPERIKNKNGLMGGNMLTAFKQLGVIGVMTDGPSRDLEEIRPMGIQCMFTGLSAGHGNFSVQAVNTPVNICGMDLAPGEIAHIGEEGAVKFPANYLEEVYSKLQNLQALEEKKQSAMRTTTSPEKLANIMKGVFED